MARPVIALAVLLLADVSVKTAADAFLKSRSELVNKQEVRQLLLSELAGRKDRSNLHKIEHSMEPLFASLPKNTLGRLDAPQVRYALHRYFEQKFAWHVKGLSATWHQEANSTSAVLKARAPAYIQSLFEEHLHGHGFGLHELAAFAATMADLIHAEATSTLRAIYKAKGLPTNGLETMRKEDADSAVEDFLVTFLLIGVETDPETPAELEKMRERLIMQYPDFQETQTWFMDFRRTLDLTQAMRRNPFVVRAPTFDDSVATVLEFSHKFGSYQNLECRALKRKLTDMEFMGTGRVRLAEFYSDALNGGWELQDSVQYLRNQGALDETDPSRPSVVIPNYINSLANCLTTSHFYGVCCINECNALMTNLEKTLESPAAAPASIVRVVSGMESDTIDAPRNLSSTLLARLDEIANHHGGSVPLHGRLFAQWMHHAYPRECAFPHVSGSVNAMTQVQFANMVGVEALQASSEEMESHVSWKHDTSIMADLPWIHVEEELAVNMYKPGKRGSSTEMRSSLTTLAALVALASFLVPMYRALRDGLVCTQKSKVESVMV